MLYEGTRAAAGDPIFRETENGERVFGNAGDDVDITDVSDFF